MGKAGGVGRPMSRWMVEEEIEGFEMFSSSGY